jgi:predicted PurR-regulated permease PerM
MISKLGDREKFHRVFILVLAVVVSAVFLYMIRGFIVTVLMAAIFAGLAHPLYRGLLRGVRGRRAAAAILTLLTLLVLVVLPLVAFLGIVATEAVSISQSVTPWVRDHLREPGEISRLLERVPYFAQIQEQIQAYSAQIIEKLGELAGRVSSFLVNSLSEATKGTVGFLFQLFVMIYAMFFFLVGGRGALDKAMVYVPLPESDKELLLDKFVSVARATLKGTFVVGLVQGGLAGLALAVVGIQGSAFWGTLMVVLSIIPGIGTALVWVPAVIYLFAVGKTASAVGLALWCALVVGTVDNFLRPKLVGADTKMPDLLILLSTFGGLSLFGAVGLVLGPIIAAVFIAVWQIYGEAFGDLLRTEDPAAADGPPVADPDPPKDSEPA